MSGKIILYIGSFLLIAHGVVSEKLPGGKDLQEDNLVEIIRHYGKGQNELLEEHLGPLLPTEEQNTLDDFLHLMEDNSTTCTLCKRIVRLLMRLAENNNWTDVRDPIVNICITLGNVLTNVTGSEVKGEIICPGTVDSQGPPIYEVLLGVPPGEGEQRICENLNGCVPPRQTKKAGNQRIRTRNHHQGAKKHHQGARTNRRALNTVKVIQITDIHMDPKYAEGSPTDCGLPVCCQGEEGQGEAGPWGDYACNTPQRTVNLFLEKVAEMDPEFIIYSGDTPPHSIWEETFHSQLECSQILMESINKTLSEYKVYPNIGNHEMYPTNLYYKPSEYTQNMADAIAQMWQPFAKFEEEQMTTMQDAGYYSIEVQPGLRILSFNTNYMYSFNWYNSLNQDRDEGKRMFEFTEQALRKARGDGEKVILIGHHPLGGGDIIVTRSRPFTDLLVDFGDVIVLYLAGHTHRDEFRLIIDPDTNEAKAVILVAPSVTPRGRINPSFRVFHMDPETFEFLDFDHYYFDLAAIGGAEPDIVLSYTASEEYHLQDLSAQEYFHLIHRFGEEDEIFQAYHQNYNSKATNTTCNENCKQSRLCGLCHSNNDETMACRNGLTEVCTPNEDETPSSTIQIPRTTDGEGIGGAALLSPTLGLVLVSVLYGLMKLI